MALEAQQRRKQDVARGCPDANVWYVHTRTVSPETLFGQISLTPGANGRLEVYLDGEKIFDRKEEEGKYPDLARVRELKQVIKAKLDSLVAAD